MLSLDDAGQLFDALTDLSASNFCILLTGSEDIFANCIKSIKHTRPVPPQIRIAEHNESDIKSFINSEIKAHKIFQGRTPGTLDITDTILKNVPTLVDGNFTDVKQIFDNVKEAVEAEEPLDRIIKLVGKNTLEKKQATWTKLLNELNKSLNTREIEQLNEILVWTNYAVEPINLEMMQSALYLRTQREPIQSLQDKVTQTYFKIVYINETLGSRFEMRDPDLGTHFREAQRPDSKEPDDPMISMSIQIHHVKLSSVQRFFWDLGEKVVLNKFSFTSSGAGVEEAITKTALVNPNRTDAHMTLARRCFNVLLNEPML